MLDLRYHVASLSAVFLALIVGILVGVGISGRGFVDKSERRNFENRIAALQAQVDRLSAQKGVLAQQGSATRAFVEDTYPTLMHGLLTNRRIAVIVVGSSAGTTGGDVTQALSDAGATTAVYRAVKEPVARAPLRRALRGLPGFLTLPDIAHELAQEWVTGGKAPVADRISPLIVEEQRGDSLQPVDGVVVIETQRPPDAATARFVHGLLGGLAIGAAPVVGAERSFADPSLVPLWRRVSGMSTVDDVDAAPGKLALALLLAGAPPGSYGVDPAADALLPPLDRRA